MKIKNPIHPTNCLSPPVSLDSDLFTFPLPYYLSKSHLSPPYLPLLSPVISNLPLLMCVTDKVIFFGQCHGTCVYLVCDSLPDNLTHKINPIPRKKTMLSNTKSQSSEDESYHIKFNRFKHPKKATWPFGIFLLYPNLFIFCVC